MVLLPVPHLDACLAGFVREEEHHRLWRDVDNARTLAFDGAKRRPSDGQELSLDTQASLRGVKV